MKKIIFLLLMVSLILSIAAPVYAVDPEAWEKEGKDQQEYNEYNDDFTGGANVDNIDMFDADYYQENLIADKNKLAIAKKELALFSAAQRIAGGIPRAYSTALR